jgi:hypothetical protein
MGNIDLILILLLGQEAIVCTSKGKLLLCHSDQYWWCAVAANVILRQNRDFFPFHFRIISANTG